MADGAHLRVVDDIFDLATTNNAPKSGNGGDGSGGDELERRVSALEKGLEGLNGKLDKLIESVSAGRLESERRFSAIESRLAVIESKIDTKAAKTDLGPVETRLSGLDGKVGMLPTTTVMITTTLSAVGLSLAGAAGLAFTLFKIFKP